MLLRAELCRNAASQFSSAHVRELRRKARPARPSVPANVVGRIPRAPARQARVRDSAQAPALRLLGRPRDSVPLAAHRGPDSAMFHVA